jgi:outer membrane protein
MKFKRALLAVSAVVLMTVFSAPQAAEYKIGFVEVARILAQAPQIAAIRDKLKKEFSRRDEELLAQGKEIKALSDQLSKDGKVMSESEAARLEKDILARRRKLKNAQTAFQEDLNLRQNEELQKIRKQIAEIIQTIAKDGGYDLVLESGVVFASDRANITDQILDRMKKEANGK